MVFDRSSGEPSATPPNAQPPPEQPRAKATTREYRRLAIDLDRMIPIAKSLVPGSSVYLDYSLPLLIQLDLSSLDPLTASWVREAVSVPIIVKVRGKIVFCEPRVAVDVLSVARSVEPIEGLR